MSYPDYLIHFNKLHSKKNGQFISGDGDGDGTADEHHRYSKNGIKSSSGYKLSWGNKTLLNNWMGGNYKTGDRISQKELKKYLPKKKDINGEVNSENSSVKYTQMKLLKTLSKKDPSYKDAYNTMKKQYDTYIKNKQRENDQIAYERSKEAMKPGSVINTQVRSYAFGKFLSSDGYKRMNTGEKYVSTQLASYTLSKIFK